LKVENGKLFLSLFFGIASLHFISFAMTYYVENYVIASKAKQSIKINYKFCIPPLARVCNRWNSPLYLYRFNRCK